MSPRFCVWSCISSGSEEAAFHTTEEADGVRVAAAIVRVRLLHELQHWLHSLQVHVVKLGVQRPISRLMEVDGHQTHVRVCVCVCVRRFTAAPRGRVKDQLRERHAHPLLLKNYRPTGISTGEREKIMRERERLSRCRTGRTGHVRKSGWSRPRKKLEN